MIGATGVVGRALVPALAAGHEVVAVARRRPAELPAGVRFEAADATDADGVRRVLEGVEVGYYLVHSLGSADFAARDAAAARTFAQAAAAAELRQIVYLGGIGDDTGALSPHLHSRAETARILASGSVPVTAVGAAMIVGPGSAAFATILALVDRLPLMICPRWVSVPTQPIALADVVGYLAGLCGLEPAFGESFDAGGPEVMTYRAMIERIARLRGHARRPLIIEVPVLSPRLSSLWLHLVTPVEAAVARPLVEGLRTPTVARDDRLQRLVPIPLTPFDDAALAAMGTA